MLYPLLEALVDGDAIVRQAAQCTLQRIALYVEGASLQGLVRYVRVNALCNRAFCVIIVFSHHLNRNNLDYIVDRVCLQLRSPRASGSASGSGNSSARAGTSTNTSTHLIVDFVFSTIDTTVQDSSSGSDEEGNVDKGEIICSCI